MTNINQIAKEIADLEDRVASLSGQLIDAKSALVVRQKALIKAKEEQATKKVCGGKDSFEVDNIRTKDTIRYGTKYAGSETGVAARGVKNTHITFIADTYSHRSIENGEQTFKVGDDVIYDSHNLHFWGNITGITEKGISITKKFGGNCRLDLATFMVHNLGCDYDQIRDQDSDTMNYI